MDDGVEAGVGFVGAHGNALELFEFAEEVLNEVTPFVHLGIERQGLGPARMLGDDDLSAALVKVGNDVVAVESLVSNQGAKLDPVDERRHADGIEAMARQEDEADQVAEGVGEREDFGGHATLGAAYGLALSPPFAPCPWRWTFTIVASTMAYSISGSSEQALKSRMKTSALTRSRYRLKTVFQLPKKLGKSRHGLPVRTIHNTASMKRRLKAAQLAMLWEGIDWRRPAWLAPPARMA